MMAFRFGSSLRMPKDLLRLLASLAHANLALRVVQHVVAGVGRVRGVNADGNGADEPTSVEGEEVLRGVKADDAAARSRLLPMVLAAFENLRCHVRLTAPT